MYKSFLGQTLRLLWPEEVKADEASCQRSKATGELVITAPKVKRSLAAMRLAMKEKGMDREEIERVQKSKKEVTTPVLTARKSSSETGRVKRVQAPTKLADVVSHSMHLESSPCLINKQMLQAAVDYRNIVKHNDSSAARAADMVATAERRLTDST